MPTVPPSNVIGSSGLTHQASVYYDRLGLDKLLPMIQFQQVCESKPLPRNAGRTIQWYRFTAGVANTNPASDGVIGNPLSLASNTVSATVEEYNDHTSSSTLLEETDISPTVENMVANMSERGALTADTLARTEADSSVATTGVSTVGAYLSVADYKRNSIALAGLNIRPHTGQDYIVIQHPFVRYDVVSDNTAGGFIDAMKYTAGTQVLNGEIGRAGGCRILETTNVGTSGTAPSVLYYTYLFGYRPMGCVDLSGSGPSQITDLNNQRFQTLVSKGGPSGFDPAGTTGTYVAYRFVTAFKLLYTSNDQYRLKIIKADASLV